MDAVGFIELNSIARGFQVTDNALKSSDIQLISAFPGCPGKFYFLFSGMTAPVAEALKIGVEAGGENVVDSMMISRVHPDVISAMSRTTQVPARGAVGIMEFFSVTAAIFAGDAAVKTADVSLIEIRCGLGIGGKSYVTLTGDVSAVQAAVNVGVSAGSEHGMVVASSVIANPDPRIFEALS